MSDALIQVSVSMPGKPMVSYRFRVDHVYGTLTRAVDGDKVIRDAVASGLRRIFGGSVKLEAQIKQEPVHDVSMVKRGPGRPRKVTDDVPSGG